MRTSSVAALLVLAGCSRDEQAAQTANAAAPTATPVEQASAPAAEESRVPCAHGPAALEPACTVDQVQGEQGLTLTLRHPDGAFRRLLVTTDGRGVVAADGAEPARVTVVGDGEIEVAIGTDRYRLPATVRAGG